MNKHLTVYYLISALLLFSCDAPHENPLDPDNSGSTFGTLKGQVLTYSFPRRYIADAYVLWGPSNTITYTNSLGNFTIENVSPQDGMLYFQKDGYTADSVLVEWVDGNSESIEVYLNSIPQLVDGSLTSSVENRSSNIQNYKIIVDVELEDDEGDVDSVFLFNSELEVRKMLSKLSVDTYEDEYSISDLNLSSVGEIIGKEFTIIAKDQNANEFDIADLTVKRVIKDQIELQSPLNSEVVGDTVDFVWTRFEPGYTFHYLLQIYTDTVDPDLIWQKDNISSDEISYETIRVFDSDNYFWVLWVIDEFGNRARSSPRKFIVE